MYLLLLIAQQGFHQQLPKTVVLLLQPTAVLISDGLAPGQT
jgi:hypothetical protein